MAGKAGTDLTSDCCKTCLASRPPLSPATPRGQQGSRPGLRGRQPRNLPEPASQRPRIPHLSVSPLRCAGGDEARAVNNPLRLANSRSSPPPAGAQALPSRGVGEPAAAPEGLRGGGSTRRLWNSLAIPPPAGAPLALPEVRGLAPAPGGKVPAPTRAGTRAGPDALRWAAGRPSCSPRLHPRGRPGGQFRKPGGQPGPGCLRASDPDPPPPGRPGRGARSSGRAAQSDRLSSGPAPGALPPPGPAPSPLTLGSAGGETFPGERRGGSGAPRPSGEPGGGAWARRGPRARQQRHRAEAGRSGGAASAGPATRAGLGLGLGSSSGSGAGGGSGRAAAAARLVYSGRCQRLRRPGLLLLRRRAPSPSRRHLRAPQQPPQRSRRPGPPRRPCRPAPGPRSERESRSPRAPALRGARCLRLTVGAGRKWGQRSQSPRGRPARRPGPTARTPAPGSALRAASSPGRRPRRPELGTPGRGWEGLEESLRAQSRPDSGEAGLLLPPLPHS